jgi:hypothetical protein
MSRTTICFSSPQIVGLSRRLVLSSGLSFLAFPKQGLAGWADSIRHLAGQLPTLRIGLVDVSKSLASGTAVEAHTLAALKAFFAKSQPGDELIVGTIGEERMDRVRQQNRSLARSGKMFQDKQLLTKAVQDELEWATAELAKPKSLHSRYTETLAAHQPDVMRALQQGANVQVMIAGDGLESSEWCDFENTQKLNERSLPSLIDQLASRRMLLRDPSVKLPEQVRIDLMLVGAGGQTSASWQLTRTFWEAYCNKAVIQLAYYGFDLPPFM